MHIPSPRFWYLLAPLGIAFIFWGLRNRPDPTWQQATELLRQPHFFLQDVPDSLQLLYRELHGNHPGAPNALQLVSYPSLSNIEWTAFQKLVRKAAEKRLLVVSGVTGTGATKQARRAANVLAGNTDRVLPIDCAPLFDLELHKRYIGYEEPTGAYVSGALLDFWNICHRYPEQKFAVIIDNFDKINPETFFGPTLWEALSSKKPSAVVGGDSVLLPPNCYLLSVTHLGPGSHIDFNEEHFKRLGPQFVIPPNPRELCAWLRMQPKNEKDEAKLTLLRDSSHLQRFVYGFLKSNALLQKKYGDGYQLGQGSNLRECYDDPNLEELKRVCTNHIMALKSNEYLDADDFAAMDYSTQNKGLAYRSSFLARQVQWLHDTGYFVEITMVATTALLTALAGWWVFRRREQLIRTYGERTRSIYEQFENQQLGAESAARQLEAIKTEVDELVLRRRLGYTEGLYFLAFIEDRVKRVEFAKNISENFLELFNAFMEDDILTESEYFKLRQFLQSIRHKIPEEIYEQFNKKVEQAYK